MKRGNKVYDVHLEPRRVLQTHKIDVPEFTLAIDPGKFAGKP